MKTIRSNIAKSIDKLFGWGIGIVFFLGGLTAVGFIAALMIGNSFRIELDMKGKSEVGKLYFVGESVDFIIDSITVNGIRIKTDENDNVYGIKKSFDFDRPLSADDQVTLNCRSKTKDGNIRIIYADQDNNEVGNTTYTSKTVTSFCNFILKKYYDVLITIGSSLILLGLVRIYLTSSHTLRMEKTAKSRRKNKDPQ